MYQRVCKCGNPFETGNYRQVKCRRDCGHVSKNAARKLRQDTNDIEFVGVDGEGVDRPDGTHEYVMLSVGSDTLWNDGYALSLDSILRFLYDHHVAAPESAFVGFFLGYDFIQWEKLLPKDRAYLLLTERGIATRKSRRTSRANPYPDAVVWNGWEIDIMAGRRFKLRPHLCHRSEWTGLCRNRTCGKDLTPTGDVVVQPGEMEWSPPDDDVAMFADFPGSDKQYWDVLAPSLTHSVGSGSVKGKAYSWMYICDTGPFWQTSFLNVINPEGWYGTPVCNEEEYRTIVDGKAQRGITVERGSTSYYHDMVRYNVLENDILARVTKRLNQGFMNERIPIKIPRADWYGPGRAAQLWMDQLHELACDVEAKEYNKYVARNNASTENPRLERKNETGLLNADVYMSLPTWFYEAAQSSYYGGWFEQFMHGHVGNAHEYDINSAYPHIIASLPCLHTTGKHNGVYTRGDNSESCPSPEKGRYTLVYCTVVGTNPYIGAMPYRDKHGLISRPQQTKGWYWQHELEASRNASLVDDIIIEEWVSYQACTCTPPFNPDSIGITSLYQLRLDFGKNTPQGKSAKLVYNSAYGKTAQSIGQPKYSNPIYASLITAGCRTLILEAISTHPVGAAHVSMVATDGIYFITPHTSLNINPTELGAWDEGRKENLTQLMPGVYWDEKTRARVKKGLAPQLKSRGVSARDLAKEIDRLDGMFALAHRELERGGEYVWPQIEFKTGFLLDSAKLALQRNKWETAGRVTHGAVRKISSDPSSKRSPYPYVDGAEGIVRSRPYRRAEVLESTPYNKAFGYDPDERDAFPGQVGMDENDPMMFFKEWING